MHSKLRFLTLSIIAVFIIGVIAALAFGTSSAEATPGHTGDCANCHTYQGGNLRISADTSSTTVAAGASFVVNISWTGGGGSRMEINWPIVQDNSQFNPSPRVPYSSSGTSGSTSSTLTAPATPGIYTVRVYATQSSPSMETDYQDISITVAMPSYTITATAGANGTIAPSGAVTVSSGADQSFSITPDSGYHVAGVIVDGASVGAVTSYDFTGVTANHSISASFAQDAPETTSSVPDDDEDGDDDDETVCGDRETEHELEYEAEHDRDGSSESDHEWNRDRDHDFSYSFDDDRHERQHASEREYDSDD